MGGRWEMCGCGSGGTDNYVDEMVARDVWVRGVGGMWVTGGWARGGRDTWMRGMS